MRRLVLAALVISGCSTTNFDVVRNDFKCGNKIVRFEIQPGSDEELIVDFFRTIGSKCQPLEKVVILGERPSVIKFSEIEGKKAMTITRPKQGVKTKVKVLADSPDSVIRLGLAKRVEMTFDTPADERAFQTSFEGFSF